MGQRFLKNLNLLQVLSSPSNKINLTLYSQRMLQKSLANFGIFHKIQFADAEEIVNLKRDKEFDFIKSQK